MNGVVQLARDGLSAAVTAVLVLALDLAAGPPDRGTAAHAAPGRGPDGHPQEAARRLGER